MKKKKNNVNNNVIVTGAVLRELVKYQHAKTTDTCFLEPMKILILVYKRFLYRYIGQYIDTFLVVIPQISHTCNKDTVCN